MATTGERNALRFRAKIERIGINPFVFVPSAVLMKLFVISGRNKGPIPVSGTVNRKSFKQALLRYRGHWRLYVNTTMLKNSPKRVGETILVTLSYDLGDRTVPLHPALGKALIAIPRQEKHSMD